MLPFVDKMGIDSTIVAWATNNLDQLYDVQVMIGLAWLLLILIVVHSFVKFAQLWDLFVHLISLLQFPFIRKIYFRCIVISLSSSREMFSSILMG